MTCSECDALQKPCGCDTARTEAPTKLRIQPGVGEAVCLCENEHEHALGTASTFIYNGARGKRNTRFAYKYSSDGKKDREIQSAASSSHTRMVVSYTAWWQGYHRFTAIVRGT